MDQPWHSVFANSMHPSWLYFYNRFDASVVNSLTLAIPYASYHLVFIDDFKVYKDSIFTDDLWISGDKAFLTIPGVSNDSNFVVKSMCRPWLLFCYRFHAWAVNYLTLSIPYVSYDSDFSDDFKVYSNSVFTDDLWITSDIPFLTIPCVSHDSIFAIDLIRRSGIHSRCRFHTSAVTQFLVKISRSRVGCRWRFLVSTDGVFTGDCMRHGWLCFLYWFHASIMN
jgi:hypothetical protein